MIKRIIEFSAQQPAARAARRGGALRASPCYTLKEIRLDALPDLSDTQVIVYSRWDRSPDIIEDQVTYPIITALLGAPKVKAIRGFSDFGFSFVYVIFQDGTDLYWARSRVLEYLSQDPAAAARGRADRARPGRDRRRLGLPVRAGRPLAARTRSTSCARTRTGRCATPCSRCPAWPRSPRSAASSSSTRSPSTPTASPPTASRSTRWSTAVRELEQRGRRPPARVSRRRVHGARPRLRASRSSDFEQIVVKVGAGGVPVLLRDVARVELGPEIRRGVSDLDGLGDARRRHRRHAPRRERPERHQRASRRSSQELEPSLPTGVEIVTTYDRVRPDPPRHRHPEARADRSR